MFSILQWQLFVSKNIALIYNILPQHPVQPQKNDMQAITAKMLSRPAGILRQVSHMSCTPQSTSGCEGCQSGWYRTQCSPGGSAGAHHGQWTCKHITLAVSKALFALYT